MTDPWSEWKLYPDWQPDLSSFKETLDGGQAFCWHPANDHSFEGVVLDFPLRIRWEDPHQVYWSVCARNPVEAETFISVYLGTNSTYQEYYDTLPWRSDPHLKRCMARFPALRILAQPAGETLLGFLCSATKQIVQIKEMLNLLRTRFGNPLPAGHKSLPSWNQLIEVEETDLRDCKFGFRAGNIKKSAGLLSASPGAVETAFSLPYPEAKTFLCTLPGVGEKVADCALLFGYRKLEAFPVDTWILKAMRRHYALTGWTPKQVAHFGRIHFGACAGLAQQFLFAWERSEARK